MLAELLSEFGYDSITDLLSETRALPSQSHIKDLNGDNAANVLDAQYLLQFVNGMRIYENRYSDLDVTDDYVVNDSDAFSYLQYVAHYMSQQLPAPFSSSNGPYGSSDSFEFRSYVKCDYPSLTTITYILDDSNLLTNVNGNISLLEQDTVTTQTETVVQANNRDGNNPTSDTDMWSINYDSRMVRVGETINGVFTPQSTGFIIGEHLIATASHCVCNIHPGYSLFNPYRSVTAYLYTVEDDSIVSTPYELTVTSVHVPLNFVQSLNASFYEYGLIEVEEDLSDFGCFNLGIITDYAPTSSDGQDEDLLLLRLQQFQNPNAPLYTEEQKKYPLLVDGWLRGIGLQQISMGSSTSQGSSGSVIYLHDNNTAVGIIWGTNQSATRITRPLLQFYLNNQYITDYDT